MTDTPVSDTAVIPPSPAKPRHSGKVRAIAATLIFVVAAALTSLGMLLYWGNRTVTDTQQYLATVAPLASNTQVQDDLSTFITDKVNEQIDSQAIVEQAFAGLLEKQPALQMMVPVVAGAIDSLISSIVDKLVHSEQFENLWSAANLAAQKGLMAILEGNDSGPISLQGDQVVLDVSQVIDQVKQGLVDKGLGFAANIDIPVKDQNIVLLEAPQLAQIRTIYSFTSPIATYFVFFVVILYLVAIFLARRRPRMVAWTGGAVLVNGLILVIALGIGQSVFVNQLKGTPFEKSSEIFYDTLLKFLYNAATVTIVLGIILMLCGLYLCNARWAVALRSKVNAFATQFAPAGLASSGAAVAKFARWIRVAIAVLFVIIVLFGGDLSLSRTLWAAGISLVLLIALQIWVAAAGKVEVVEIVEVDAAVAE